MTTIQWTDETWNMLRARNKATGGIGHFCVKVDDACSRCYAEPYQVRVKNPIRYAAQDLPLVDLFLDDKVLRRPLSKRTPTMFFPCSMTDLFAEFYPDKWVDAVLAVAALTPHHLYQVLTKRAQRMHDYFTLWPDGSARKNYVFVACLHLLGHDEARGARRDAIVKRAQEATEVWPLPNWWQGVSAGTQKGADERLPLLRKTDVALRWLSAEPLLESIDVSSHLPGIDWGVVGGESGRRARVCNAAHITDVVVQFKRAGKPIFVKQLGARPLWATGEAMPLVDSKGGDPAEWPEFLRVREWPEAASRLEES